MISRKRMGEVVPFHKENILNTMKTAFSGRRQQIGNRSFEELLSVFLARLPENDGHTEERVLVRHAHTSTSDKQLYIVITQTGTLLSRILRYITGAEYNHASISLSKDLEKMYSFGRRYPYNPFWGGFVMESPRTGTFKRFSDTRAIVLSVTVSEEQHAELRNMLEDMWKRRKKYRYNFAGLCLAYFHITWKRENYYYCSEFVGELLIKCRIDGAECLHSSVIQPIHFLRLPHTPLYCGKLREYVWLDSRDTILQE